MTVFSLILPLQLHAPLLLQLLLLYVPMVWYGTYLLGKPGRHKWHLERIRVRVQCVKRVRRYGAQH